MDSSDLRKQGIVAEPVEPKIKVKVSISITKIVKIVKRLFGKKKKADFSDGPL